MAQVNSSIGTGGVKRIRRWYNQYLSTHGTPPPESMMRTYMQSEIEAQIASADKSRALGLESERIAVSRESLAQQGSQYDQSLALQKEQMEDQNEAARMSGYTNMALVGVLGKDVIKSGYDKVFPGKTPPTTEAVPTGSTSTQAVPTGAANGLSTTAGAASTGVGIGTESAGGTGAVTLGAAEPVVGIGSASSGSGAVALGGAESTIGIGSTSAGGTGGATLSGGAATTGAGASSTTVAGGIGYTGIGAIIAAAIGTKDLAKSSVPKDNDKGWGIAYNPAQAGAKFAQSPASSGFAAGAPGTLGTLTQLAQAGVISEDSALGKVLRQTSRVEEKVMNWITGGSVICTELHRQGLINDETYEADERFGKKQDLEVMVGYHSWGIPLAGWMKQSKVVTWIIKPLALAWAENMAYMEGVAEKRNLLGAVIHKIGVPVCRTIGRIKTGGRVWAL